MAIVNQIEWAALDRLVEVQQRNRETHVPVISLFRWWARRSHAGAGAILDAARAEFGSGSFLVADPFSGGGTVAFEATRRGLPIYAQDLYPWPSEGLATALTAADPDEFRVAADRLLQDLGALRNKYRYDNDGERWEVTHVIRVRTADCPRCSKCLFLFRDPLISLASRRGIWLSDDPEAEDYLVEIHSLLVGAMKAGNGHVPGSVLGAWGAYHK